MQTDLIMGRCRLKRQPVQEIKRDIAIIDTLACVQMDRKLKSQLELNAR